MLNLTRDNCLQEDYIFPDEHIPRYLSEPASSEDSDPTNGSEQRFPIVAVGASAGGLEALSDLLRHLPADTGMAFVFIQHLDPSHDSMLVQLLSRDTTMPVNQVEDGTILSPNRVYVIPPNAAMTVSGITLSLQRRETAATTIDIFLRSLAPSKKSEAIAVILSGTGSDGALGVEAIAEESGVVFAQAPSSAKFDGMPRSAIETGYVDFILPPEEIASELARIACEPRLMRRDVPELFAAYPDSQREFQALLDLLQTGTGIDFGLYRQATVRRRLQRRLSLLKLGSLGDYVAYVNDKPDELQALTQDILIRVTRFFRDPEAFEVLSRTVFPALIRQASVEGVARVWVAGCSTGQEAYSIAICFQEVAERMRSGVRLQVFATDINEAVIEKARRGTYIENITGDVSPDRLGRFFVRVGREYQVSRKLRDLCIFSRHDLLNDPPFSRMGLVSCRNLLIYLDSMRQRALSRFHFALNPGGFLLLGKSETAAPVPGLFALVDRQARLYARQEAARNPAVMLSTRKKATAPHPQATQLPRRLDLRRQADLLIVERYGPPTVIVNGDLEPVTYDGGESTAFLASCSRNQQVLDLVKEGAAVRKAIQMVGKMGKPVRITQEMKPREGPPREVSIEVTPLGPERGHFLIALEDQVWQAKPAREPGETPTKPNGRQLEIRISRLERELASSRAQLESVIIEQEAATEEVVASNEELQSLNEELESSKEELEATNEELTTLNQELQVRNTELDSAREFAQATIDTVRGSLVVLGPDLRLLKANRTFYRVFRLSPGEIEHRFIYELADGAFSAPRLRMLLEEILPESRIMEDFEVESGDPAGGQRVLLLNARRFESERNILLAIEDVTESRKVEAGLRQSQKMEAIGYLAAGVAHDFNNLLTGVIGNASLLLEELRENHPGRFLVRNVIRGGERAAELTRQLLASAGKGRFYLERVDISEVVIQTSQLIHPSIPPDVQLRLDLDKHLPLLLADPGQMQQVVMNLVINGAEAIGEGTGVVLVKTGRQTVTDQPLPDLFLNEKVLPGEYIFLEVSDNGSGMDKQTIRRIFDPFFTTKFTGRGLGLAAVMGIIGQHKGAVQIHSVPGRGSTFRVLFSVAEQVPSRIAEDVIHDDLRGIGTVLVVDDEEVIRAFTRSALELYGYRVVLARDGQEGVRLFQERSDGIELVLLDVGMPGMDGAETLQKIRQIRPNVPVVICSGLGDVDVMDRFEGVEIAGFFQKPYTVNQLAKKVKDCMSSVRSRNYPAERDGVNGHQRD